MAPPAPHGSGQIPQDFVRVIGGGDGGVGFLDPALRVDQVADPRRARGVSIGGAIGDADALVRVAEQREGKAELLPEGPVLLLGVDADAKNDAVAVFELADSITESLALDRSPGGVGHRIPPERDGRAAVLIQGHGGAVLVLHRECGCRITNVQHGAHLLSVCAPT